MRVCYGWCHRLIPGAQQSPLQRKMATHLRLNGEQERLFLIRAEDGDHKRKVNALLLIIRPFVFTYKLFGRTLLIHFVLTTALM